jgi:hypothetical protein
VKLTLLLQLIAPAWENNCFMLRIHEPVLESGAFEEFCTRPTSDGISILLPWRGVESSLIVLQPGKHTISWCLLRHTGLDYEPAEICGHMQRLYEHCSTLSCRRVAWCAA